MYSKHLVCTCPSFYPICWFFLTAMIRLEKIWRCFQLFVRGVSVCGVLMSGLTITLRIWPFTVLMYDLKLIDQQRDSSLRCHSWQRWQQWKMQVNITKSSVRIRRFTQNESMNSCNCEVYNYLYNCTCFLYVYWLNDARKLMATCLTQWRTLFIVSQLVKGSGAA